MTLPDYCYTYSGILVKKGVTMKVKVTITLEDKNWQRLRMQALKDKTSASAIIDELVAIFLESGKKGGKR